MCIYLDFMLFHLIYFKFVSFSAHVPSNPGVCEYLLSNYQSIKKQFLFIGIFE